MIRPYCVMVLIYSSLSSAIGFLQDKGADGEITQLYSLRQLDLYVTIS